MDRANEIATDIFPSFQHGEVQTDISETTIGPGLTPICLVLTDDVQKIFEKGDPLIVGTTMGDIQTFFQKVIAEAQLGMEQAAPNRLLMDIGRRSTASTVRVGTSRTFRTDSPRNERYPVPVTPIRRLKSDTAAKKKLRKKALESGLPVIEPEPEDESGAQEVEEMERCEIPLDAIRVYLRDKKYFPGWSANSKRNLRKRCDDFILENGVLFYKTKKNQKVLCVEDRAERMRLIWQQHSIDHRRRDRLFSGLKDKYYWKGMLQDVNSVLDSCEFCARVRDENQSRLMPGQNYEPVPRTVWKPALPKRATLDSQPSTSKKAKTNIFAGLPEDVS